MLREEIARRQARCREIAAERALDALLVVGSSPARAGDLVYLGNFHPAMPGHVSRFRFQGRGMGAIILPLDAPAILCSTTGFFEPGVLIEDVRINADLPHLLGQVLSDAGLARGHVGIVGTDILPLSLYNELAHEAPSARFAPADDIVMNLRTVKSPYELERLRKGAAIADDVAEEIRDFIRPGLTELQVAREIINGLQRRGVSAPFATCQSGVQRSGEPMSYPAASDRVIESGDMMHMEINGRWEGYMIDICRSTVAGMPSDEQIALLETIVAMLEASTEASRPGVTGEALEACAAEIAEKAGWGSNFTLAFGGPGTYLGHSIGLGTDEPPLLMAGDKTLLKAGMVITYEPGLYRTPWGGARIEDEILITETGAESLNNSSRRWWRS